MEQVTGKAAGDQTFQDIYDTLCGEIHVGIEMIKEIDAMDRDKTILKEKKFFEMDCLVLDFGLNKNGQDSYALHFMYPHDNTLIDGMALAPYS